MRMGTRHGWLFPLMVLAAGSVTAFGCVGIAAIIGFLPLSVPGAPSVAALRSIGPLPLTTSQAVLTAPAPPASEPARQ